MSGPRGFTGTRVDDLRSRPRIRAEPVDPALFRDSMSRWATGVTVVTTSDEEGRHHGFTANSFTAVSLVPPMVLVCLDRVANCLGAFAASPRLAVHVLRHDQEELAVRFSRKEADKFAGAVVEDGVADVPLLAGALARLECQVTDRVWAGDHLILIAEVCRAEVGRPEAADGEPLVYYRQAFHRLGS